MRPREVVSFGMIRGAPPLELHTDAVVGSQMVGYASAFDYPIDSGLPGHPQTTFVRPGSFTKTLKENAGEVQSLFNHGRDPRYGMLPIGVPQRMEPDRTGLWTETQLHDGPDNANLKAALESGALRSMSIMFETMQETYNDDRTERYIEQLRLYEYGPVTFPANHGASARLQSLELFAIDLAGIVEHWDGGAALASCSSAADFRSIAFERANDSDPTTAAHWALPHHPSPGAGADPAGVAAALGALHGGRGTPSSGAPALVMSVDAVENHLQGHQAEASDDADRGDTASAPDDRFTRYRGTLDGYDHELTAAQVRMGRL